MISLRSIHFSLVVLICFSATVIAAERLGFQSQKPDFGRFVKTDQGYMVPYNQSIPGSDLVIKMVPIPGGILELAPTNSSGNKITLPVKIEPFWLGQYEVTWAQFDLFANLIKEPKMIERLKPTELTTKIKIDAVTVPSLVYLRRTPQTSDKSQWPLHPAVSMSQFGAKQYTKWLSKMTGQFYRLPAEVEWEHACKANTKSRFSFGNNAEQLKDYAWFVENSNEDTHPVGMKKPNPWGLYDMHGNAREWVLDQYSEDYSLLKASRTKNKLPVAWPTVLHPRVVRGGSWDSDAQACASSFRLGSSPEWQNYDPQLPQSPHWLSSEVFRQFGFRIARPLNPPNKKKMNKYWDADIEEIKEAVKSYTSRGHSYQGIVQPETTQSEEK